MADATADINAVFTARSAELDTATKAYNAKALNGAFDKLVAEYAPDQVQAAANQVVSAMPTKWRKPAEIAAGCILAIGLIAAAAWVLKALGHL